MNKLISFGIVISLLFISNQLFSQSRQDFQRVEKVAATAPAPQISADHNAAEASSLEDQSRYELRGQYIKLLDQLKILEKQNINGSRADDVARLKQQILEIEKQLGIN